MEKQVYGSFDLPHFKHKGYSLEYLETELLPAWKNNAEVLGSDLYDMTGDLAVGPKIVEDLINRIKELEAKLGSEKFEAKAQVTTACSQTPVG